jgi:hypothetical protein
MGRPCSIKHRSPSQWAARLTVSQRGTAVFKTAALGHYASPPSSNDVKMSVMSFGAAPNLPPVREVLGPHGHCSLHSGVTLVCPDQRHRVRPCRIVSRIGPKPWFMIARASLADTNVEHGYTVSEPLRHPIAARAPLDPVADPRPHGRSTRQPPCSAATTAASPSTKFRLVPGRRSLRAYP